MGLKIIGTGCGLPEKIITNNDLAAIMDTSDEWISQRTGIRERRILSAGESLLELSTKAAGEALAEAETKAEEIDLLIVSRWISTWHAAVFYMLCIPQTHISAPAWQKKH